LKQDIIPKDSLLNLWTQSLSITEIPFSYQVGAGLSALGAMLKRNLWVDQVDWKVYPNQSVLFIGPSGVGKDTVINKATRFVEQFQMVQVLGGKTLEAIHEQLRTLGNPACAFIPAGELSAFFGNRDYQSNMIQGFTDLLSTNDKMDISTKGSLSFNGGRKTYIYQPTLTLHGGSTEEWLHKAMPEGTMEGGFLGRFLILVEQFGGRHIPLIKASLSKQDRLDLDVIREQWHKGIEDILRKTKRPQQMYLDLEAQEYYTNWYHNRFKYFSSTVLPYANRSRDMVLRLAMLMALTRGHVWMQLPDVKFGGDLMVEVGKSIDRALLPPTNEAQAGQQILRMLPATSVELWKPLSQKFPLWVLRNAQELLEKTGQIRFDREAGKWVQIHDNN
jgi:energy-coupling factor transporter ATP-binding protein EcfA2